MSRNLPTTVSSELPTPVERGALKVPSVKYNSTSTLVPRLRLNTA